MRKRKQRWLAAGLLCAGAATYVLWPRTDPAIRGKCQRLRAGMTMAEAEAVLGLPGDSSTRYYRNGIETDLEFRRTFDPAGLADVTAGKPKATTHHWQTETTILEVHYGASGHLAAVDCYAYVGREEWPFGNLVWRAKGVLWRLRPAP